MSARLAAIRPREMVRALERAGWINVRQAGSHIQLRKDGNARVISVPQHTRDMKRGTVIGILRDAAISDEEFIELLRS